VKVLSVKIRLARAGAKKKPFYRVVVTDSRSPRDGRFIEIVGRYNPRSHPSLVEIDVERIKEWIGKGATPSETVEKLIAIAESPDTPPPVTAKDGRPSIKVAAAAKESEKAQAEETPAEPEEATSEDSDEPGEDAELESAEDAQAEPAADAEAGDSDESADEDEDGE
jgi:small subunit ribosomal protein S16